MTPGAVNPSVPSHKSEKDYEETLESFFEEYKPPLQDHEAHTEANRCLHCYDAPCIQACPTEIDIPKFIGRIGSGNTLGAARTILDSNILGHSCASACPTEVLCEGACVYTKLNKQPIRIGRLQRYAMDTVGDARIEFYKPGKPTGKRVVLVGSGPASLACAHELRKHGHETVILEKSKQAGGLNTYGLAPYKMKAHTSLREIEAITAMGVEFKFETELGKDFHLQDLIKDYDAVFLGLGLGADTRLTAAGVDHPRILGAVDFISQLKSAPVSQLQWVKELKSALVVGGGNTALDACRELKKLGIPSVNVTYRRGRENMSGYKHETNAALQEGVVFHFNTLPIEFKQGDSAGSLSVILQDTQKQTSVQEIKVGLVLLAIGQSKIESLLKEVPELTFKQGRLNTDPITGRTDHPRIYAGGDLANGGKEVVNAVAEGKRAAQAIHLALLEANLPKTHPETYQETQKTPHNNTPNTHRQPHSEVTNHG